MSNTIKKEQEMRDQALYEELEVRYGAPLAQEIIEQIKKAGDQDNKPDYLSVKALSEVLEAFREDTQEMVKKLRNLPFSKLPADVASLEEKYLQNELKKKFNCYWIVQHSFYSMYEHALKICEVPETYRYDKYTKPTEMKLAPVPARMALFNKAA